MEEAKSKKTYDKTAYHGAVLFALLICAVFSGICAGGVGLMVAEAFTGRAGLGAALFVWCIALLATFLPLFLLVLSGEFHDRREARLDGRLEPDNGAGVPALPVSPSFVRTELSSTPEG